MYRSFLLLNKGQIPVCTGIKGEMTGVNLAQHHKPCVESSTHWADIHRGTHREPLVLRPMCRSLWAGRSETIGLPRGAAQRATVPLWLQHALECNMGRQVAFCSPHTLLSKIWKSQRGPPPDTMAGPSGTSRGSLNLHPSEEKRFGFQKSRETEGFSSTVLKPVGWFVLVDQFIVCYS